MSWVTVIWSVGIGACLTLAFIQFIVWWKDRAARANLVFSVLAIAVAALAALELALMRAQTPEQFGLVTRWIHVPAWVIVTSLVAFVRLYLRAGRPWLAWAVIGVRTLSLILNFVFSPNINYWRITPLRHVSFLGESVSVATGIPNPWMLVAQLSLLLMVIFVIDAAITVWRRGDRRQALVVGGGTVFFAVLASAQAMTVTWEIIAMPITVSLFFQGLVAVMAGELSYDVLRAATLARQLQASDASLRDTEARMSLATRAAGLIAWSWDIRRDEVWLSDKDRAFFGFSQSEKLTAERVRAVVHPEDRESVSRLVERSLATDRELEAEYRLLLPDGGVRWVTRRGRVEFDGDGKPIWERGVLMDVTELKKKAEALREFEERVRLAADAAQLGVWEFDTATERLWLSDKVRELFQFPPDGEITYAEFEQRVHPEDRRAREQIMRQAIQTQSDYETEYRIVLADGKLRWIGGRARCLPEGDGKSKRLLGVSMDITERKQAQELFQLATEASPSGTVLVDYQGRILLVNSHVEKLFGYERHELIGKMVDMLVPARFAHAHAGARANFIAAPEARAMGGGRELFALRRDGSEFPVEIGLNPIQTPHGLVVLANVVDISARLAAEEVTRRSREQVELLSRVSLLGEMTASLAHELNQPLAAIVNNATAAMQYLERGRLDPEKLRDILTDVAGDGRRACDIMGNVRSAIKKGSAIRGRINLNDVVKAVTHMVQPDAASQFCKLEMSLAPDLPAIEGDPTQIQQVLINLIQNAVDAMHDTPPVRRTVHIATNYNGDGMICVAVRDYGCGISQATRERLFEQFFTTKEEGLGMGLAIVRSIVEAHGGNIAAENAEGGGARFQFRLPIGEGTVG